MSISENNICKLTEEVLANYNSIKAEIKNIELDIEEIESEYEGVSAVSFEEKTGKTNKFNSNVENEILKKEKLIKKLKREKASKIRLITKIDNSLEVLDETERKVIEYRLIKGYSWIRVSTLLNINNDYCGKIKKKAINKISNKIWVKEQYI